MCLVPAQECMIQRVRELLAAWPLPCVRVFEKHRVGHGPSHGEAALYVVADGYICVATRFQHFHVQRAVVVGGRTARTSGASVALQCAAAAASWSARAAQRLTCAVAHCSKSGHNFIHCRALWTPAGT